MKVNPISTKLSKSYRAGLVKVAVTVNGKHGQYQSHRWKSPIDATRILRDTLKKEGITDTKFKSKSTNELHDINSLPEHYKKDNQGKDFISWVKDNYVITKGTKKDKPIKTIQETKPINEEVLKHRAEIKTFNQVVKGLKTNKDIINRGVETRQDLANSIATIMDVLGIKKDGISIKTTVPYDGVNGYCQMININEDIKYDIIAVKFDSERTKNHVIKTAFHENVHLLSQGSKPHELATVGNENNNNTKIDETITEISALTLYHKMNNEKYMMPAYIDDLMTFIPKLLTLDEYKESKTIFELGEKLISERLNGTAPTSLELNNKLKDVKAEKEFYIQYHDYIENNIDEIIKGFIDAVPAARGEEEYIKSDINTAMEIVVRGGYNTRRMAGNQVLVYGAAVGMAMQGMGFSKTSEEPETPNEPDYVKTIGRTVITSTVEDMVKEREKELKEIENKLKELYTVRKPGSYIPQKTNTPKETKSHTLLKNAYDKADGILKTIDDSKEKAEFKQDMSQLYMLLSSGAITLTQALANPQFSGCAYVLWIALEEEENDIIEGDVMIIIETMKG